MFSYDVFFLSCWVYFVSLCFCGVDVLFKNTYVLVTVSLIFSLLLALIACNAGGGGSLPENQAVSNPSAAIIPNGYTGVVLNNSITQVQPMTGIVLWDTNSVWSSPNAKEVAEAISLEYSYLSISEIVTSKGVYDWAYIESKLDDITGRNHQAIFRFYYTYPGKETVVPNYIKALADYHETIGITEGKTSYFPDWSNAELQRFTQEFHTKFAEKYNNDPRIAFLQVGFGLWGEYHIYDGPFSLGHTFPSKAYQLAFFDHLASVYTSLPWSISIDANDSNYSPFVDQPNFLSHSFGLFDDSFMHEHHASSNEVWWQFFDYQQRYKRAPFGGEFSYYEYPYEQYNVLNPDIGAYGVSYEAFARKFHITYMIGNDTLGGQPVSRIKQASMASGYQYEVLSFAISANEAKINVMNIGVAPIYYDAFISVNGVRSSTSLRNLYAGESKEYTVNVAFDMTDSTPVLSIESDHILTTQTIQFASNKSK